MSFLPYGFGVRYTREKGLVLTNEDQEIKPKSPPTGYIPDKVRRNDFRSHLSEIYPSSVDYKK